MTIIRESTGTLTPHGNRMLVRIITPGTGSSGVYPPHVLEAAARDRVFPKGTHMYADHPTVSEDQERPERSIRDLAGVLTEDAQWTGDALVAEVETFDPWAPVLRQMHESIGVSIRATATVGETGPDGPVIESLDEGISVDFVTRAGRGGAVLEVLESARREDSPSTSAGVTERKEPTVAHIQIDEAEHKRLTDAAEKVAATEAERDAAVKRAEEAEAKIAAAEAAADAATVDRIIKSAGVEFTALETKGLRADLPMKDGRLDAAAFEATVKEAEADKRAAAGEGQPTGVGPIRESNTDLTDDELREALTKKGA